MLCRSMTLYSFYVIIHSTDQFCFNNDVERLEILLGDLNNPYSIKKEVTLDGCQNTIIKLGKNSIFKL